MGHCSFGVTLVMVSNVFLAGCIAVTLCAAASGGNASIPVSSEDLRLDALGVIFPGMQISIDRKKIEKSPQGKPKPGERRFADALAHKLFIASLGRE